MADLSTRLPVRLVERGHDADPMESLGPRLGSMRALVGLEIAIFRNSVRALARSPFRVTMWALYLWLLVGSAAARFAFSSRTPTPGLPLLSFTPMLGSAYVTIIGALMLLFASGRVTAFRNPAEAWLLNGFGPSSRAIATWLQLRKMSESLTRWSWMLLADIAMLVPSEPDGLTIFRTLVLSIVSMLVFTSIELPLFFLGRRRWGPPFMILGAGIAAMGVLDMAHFLTAVEGGGSPSRPLLGISVDFGAIAASMLQGSPLPLLLFAAFPAVVSVAFVALADDVLPELHHATTSTWRSDARLLRQGLGASSTRAGRSTSLLMRAKGPRTAIFAKEWLTFSRGRYGLARWAACVGLSSMFGFLAGTFQLEGHGRSSLGWESLEDLGMLLFLVPSLTSVSLGSEFAVSLWRRSDLSLYAYLLVWSVARSWRNALSIVIAPVVVGVMTKDLAMMVVMVIVSATFWWTLQASGIAIATFFPSRLDVRGPVFAFRSALSFGFLVPGIVLFVASGLVGLNPIVTSLNAGAMFIVEGIVVLWFAARRLEHVGIAIVWSERA